MKEDIKELFRNMDDFSIVEVYGYWLAELKLRSMIRTNNVVGELGEYLAIKYYKETAGLPKLQAAPTGTQNIDAISINGDRYSIKATSSGTTGVFYGLNDPNSELPEKQKFEYVILVVLDKNFSLKAIYELNWEGFLKHKRWHSRMRAWNLSINKNLTEDAKVIYFSNPV
jgi:hypothetical protein